MASITLIGFGAIGRVVAQALGDDASLRLSSVVVRERSLAEARSAAATLAPGAIVATTLDEAWTGGAGRPDLVVECAGHEAVATHVVQALASGVPCIVASVGALQSASCHEQLDSAARLGATWLRLIPGAVGGIDALCAARVGGLHRVRYRGRKPPTSWLGTPAESVCDLGALTEPRVVFRGHAREAAARFPKNANVAAIVAFAGVGLDATEVELIADPRASRNSHEVQAEGVFGRMNLVVENEALAANPKTSALAAFSLVRAIRETFAPIRI